MTEAILIVGSGAREHAIADALARSPQHPRLACFGGTRNPGIESVSSAYTVGNTNDPDAVLAFASGLALTLAIIGPEAPLAAGVADALWAAGIPVVGPTRSLARIESSKSFTRDLLARYDIPGNPFFQRFSSLEGVESVLARYPGRHVIKDDGLAGGKGVKVCGDHLHSVDDSLQFCRELAGQQRPFVIEEKLEGEEFSLLSFCDGATLRHMPVVQDHKRLLNGDKGPNTGGMGSYTDRDGSLPFLTAADIAAAQQINERTAGALAQDCGAPYRGVLYGGFMATRDGVRLIEYNARFGDPECLNLLTLLETDFVSVCRAIVDGTLSQLPVSFAAQASVCKYVVPQGYPEKTKTGVHVVVPTMLPSQVSLFLGSVDLRGGHLVSAGSRTVGVVGKATSILAAEALCEEVVQQIEGPFVHRSDIGTPEAIAARVAHMKVVRA